MALADLHTYLDIWDPFDVAGGGVSWSASTYANWISGIDTMLTTEIGNGSVVKTDLGAVTGGSLRMYSYTAGATNGRRVLLMAGVHGDEYLSGPAAMRWFQQFVQSNSTAMSTLRSLIKVVWVPTVNPTGYRSTRETSGSVDINRNYPFYWANYTPEDAEHSKGSAALDTAEATIIKGLVDNQPISAVIDCHTTRSNDPDTIQWASPSVYAHSNRAINYAAGSLWEQIYGQETDRVQELDGPYGTPDGVSWAAAYMRYTLQRYNAAAVTIEGPENWHSSSSSSFTRSAVQRYCGYITLWLAQWLAAGQAPTAPAPMTWRMRRTAYDHSTSFGSGGTLLNTSGSDVFLQFDDYPGAGSPRDYLDLVLPYPGRFAITYAGQFQSLGGTAGTVYANLHWGAGTTAPTTTIDYEGSASAEVSATNGQRFNFSGHWITPYYSTVGTNIYRLRFSCYKASPTGNIGLARVAILIHAIPEGDVVALPFVGGTF